MVLAIAAGLLVLISPACRTGMSPAALTSTSPATIATAHHTVPGDGCADMAGPGDQSCRGGAATTMAQADQFNRSSVAAAQAFATPTTGTPGSVPTPGTSMLACITVLMVVLAAISQLRMHRSAGAAPPANLAAPLQITCCARRATLAELCVLRT